MKNQIYTCPETLNQLDLTVEKNVDGEVIEGFFQNEEGTKYPIKDGIPNFIFPALLSKAQEEQLNYYNQSAEVYDSLQNVTFSIQNEDEDLIRKKMVQDLNLTKTSKVLEIGCGTGIDSQNIAAQLGESGELFLQDISSGMLKQCKEKMRGSQVPIEFSTGEGSYLSFPDKYFDAVFSFGGFNTFEDTKRSLEEMVRVTKVGGTIIVGDESMPPWLYHTEFAKVLMNSNALFKYKLPLEELPVEARDVAVKWIIGGVFYLISFTVGEGEPKANFDVKIPGARGGTLKTRYYGQLEGVSETTKKSVLQAAKNQKISVCDWLEKALNSHIEKG